MVTSIHKRAEEDLSFIRSAMARTEGMSAVSGWAIMGMGVVALAAGALAGQSESLTAQLKYWLIAAPMAVAIGILGSFWKSRRSASERLRDPVQRFLLCLLPPIGVAAVLTNALWGSEVLHVVPGVWLLLYGCGVMAAGTYAVRPIALMGGGFIACGLLAMTLPGEWQNPAMAASFGLLHLATGWQVVRRHGG